MLRYVASENVWNTLNDKEANKWSYSVDWLGRTQFTKILSLLYLFIFCLYPYVFYIENSD